MSPPLHPPPETTLNAPSAPYPALGAGPGLPRGLASRQIHVVMGKGGVGKSMVALGLALGFLRAGKKVLLVQVNTSDAHGPLLGCNVGPELSLARAGLTVVNIEPAAARREYVMMMLKFRAVYDAVFENRFAQYFLRFVPSLAELNMMGKVYFHAEEEEAGRPRFDHVILDAPATGHGLTLMKVSRVIAATAPGGPLKTQTLKMTEVFENPQRTALHVVTTPDELSVMETEELVGKVTSGRVGPLGVAVLNRIPRRLFEGVSAAPWQGFSDDKVLGPVARCAVEREEAERMAGLGYERLKALGMPVLGLGEAAGSTFDLSDAEAMAQVLLPPPRVVEAL